MILLKKKIIEKIKWAGVNFKHHRSPGFIFNSIIKHDKQVEYVYEISNFIDDKALGICKVSWKINDTIKKENIRF